VIEVLTHLEENVNNECEDLIRDYEKRVILATIDDNWKEHLRELDDLKQSVQNATYEQKDPLLIYKFESFELFRAMLDKVNKEVVGMLIKGQIPVREPDEVRGGEKPRRRGSSNVQASKQDYGSAFDKEQEQRKQQKAQPVRVGKKVGRNDPCPCGSGKKYKNCHLKLEMQEHNN
jgi:preprotein translocase subunit SecA